MSYATSTVGEILKKVNTTHFLPAIQRPYVWSSDQVVSLFDSLLKRYPISSFMFWAVDEETKQEVKIYRFFETYRDGAVNDAASPDGRNVVLVLDGQQRLTSLQIGLRGTFAEKQKHKRQSNPDAWSTKTLYLNLLKDPDSQSGDDEPEFGVSYGLKFHDLPPRNDHRHYWIKLGNILNFEDIEKFEALVSKVLHELHHGVTPFERNLAETTLRRLHEVVWVDDSVNYYTESNQSVDRVLDIFVRANSGGVELSKSDLLMSMITSKWVSGTARDDIFAFINFINRDLPSPNKITKDFILKSCLVLCDFDVRYNVSNFTVHAISQIEEKWSAIKNALERTFRLLNGFGICSDNLSSLNAVLPIAYFLYRTPEFTFLGSSEFERINVEAMQRWLLNSLLVGAFAGASDRTISIARATIRANLAEAREFPIEPLFKALATSGRLSQLDTRGVEELLSLKYGKPKTFLALSMLYTNLDWNGEKMHVDHIIPRSLADRRVLMGMNFPESRILQILDQVDRLGNLQLLPAGENLEKNDLPFASWITGRRADFLSCHAIPDQSMLWSASMLPEFVQAREGEIRKKLLKMTQLKAAE